MSDTFDHSAMRDDDLLAAEYALGVLAGAERAAAQERVARERNQPCHRACPAGIEVRGLSPHSYIDLLQHVFCLAALTQDTKANAKKLRRGQTIDGL